MHAVHNNSEFLKKNCSKTSSDYLPIRKEKNILLIISLFKM